MKGYRKLIAGMVGLAILATLGFLKTDVDSDVAWGIVAIVGLFFGGNAVEYIKAK